MQREVPYSSVVSPGRAALGFACVALATTGLRSTGTDWLYLGLAVGIALALVAAAVTLPWQRLPVDALVVLPLACDGLIALLRQAQGGSRSGYSALLVLPVVWIAFVGGRRSVLFVVAAEAATLALPIALVGAPGYPSTGWRGVLLLSLVSAIVGLVVEHGVSATRRHGEAEAHRARVARAELFATMTEHASTDALTGLANRRSWDDQLVRAIAHAERTQETLSVAVCDVDGLKELNDRQGHAAGDALLRSIAARWRADARAADLIARIGGDEFAILLPGADEVAAHDVVERLVAALPAGASVSFGIAEWDLREGAVELMSRADLRMYGVKRRGKARASSRSFR